MDYTSLHDSLRKYNDKYTQLPINIPFDHDLMDEFDYEDLSWMFRDEMYDNALTHELDYNGCLLEDYEDPADYLRPVRGVRLA